MGLTKVDPEPVRVTEVGGGIGGMHRKGGKAQKAGKKELFHFFNEDGMEMDERFAAGSVFVAASPS